MNNAKKHHSVIISELLAEMTPVEQMQTDIKMTLAVRIDELIKSMELSKKEFADKIGKNASEISKWLSGTHNFTIDTLTEIAMALGKTVPELFSNTAYMVENPIPVSQSEKAEYLAHANEPAMIPDYHH